MTRHAREKMVGNRTFVIVDREQLVCDRTHWVARLERMGTAIGHAGARKQGKWSTYLTREVGHPFRCGREPRACDRRPFRRGAGPFSRSSSEGPRHGTAATHVVHHVTREVTDRIGAVGDRIAGILGPTARDGRLDPRRPGNGTTATDDRDRGVP